MSTTVATETDFTQANLDSIRTIVASGDRPNRPGPLASSLTHSWRALLRIRHVPEQLFDVTAFPIMMTLMFTFLFGGALAGSVKEYVQFFIPGILVQSIMFITMYSGVGLAVDAEKGVFDRFRSMPMWRPSAIVGPLLGDTARYSIASLVLLVLGFAIGFRPDGGLLGVLAGVAVLLVFCFSLSWVWTFFGLKLRGEKAVMSISMMVMFPLTFISSIFVDPATMPSVLETLVAYNPVTWVADSVRGLMTSTLDTTDLVKTAGACAFLVAVFGHLTMATYRKK